MRFHTFNISLIFCWPSSVFYSACVFALCLSVHFLEGVLCFFFLCLGELMVLALDSFRFSFVALSEFEDFPFSRNWLLLRELVRLWLASLNIAFSG